MIDYIECPYCDFEGDYCDFPDLFYPDSKNTKALNEQYKLLLDLQGIGYNIVTCGMCGCVFIVKHSEVK